VPLIAPSHGFIAVKSKETEDIDIVPIKSFQSKTSPLNLIAIIKIPGNPPVQQLFLTANGSFLFVQIMANSLQVFKNVSNQWQATKTFTLPTEETLTFIGSGSKDALLMGTSKNRVLQWNPVSFAIEFSISPEDEAWKGHAVVSAAISQSEKCLCMSLTSNTALIVSLPSGCVRKILSRDRPSTAGIRHLKYMTCSEYFCLGSAGKTSYVWEIWSGHSSPRHTCPHTAEVCGMNENKCRLVTGTRDGSIHVWSILTGQKLHQVTPLPKIRHRLSHFHIVGLDTAIMTFMSGIFVVKFKADARRQKLIPFEDVSKDRSLLCTSSVPENSHTWKNRLLGLLNQQYSISTEDNKSEVTCTFPMKRPLPLEPQPMMRHMPFEEAMTLGCKETAANLQMKKKDPLPVMELLHVVTHEEMLVKQMNTLLHHSRFGAVRQNLLADGDADAKKLPSTRRQTGKKTQLFS
jgi:WD40 repeat protein